MHSPLYFSPLLSSPLEQIFSKALSLILNLPLDWALQPSDPVMVSCFLSSVYTALRGRFLVLVLPIHGRPSRFPSAGSDGLSRLHAFVVLLSFRLRSLPRESWLYRSHTPRYLPKSLSAQTLIPKLQEPSTYLTAPLGCLISIPDVKCQSQIIALP